jgi:hypothetical protein
MAGQAQLDDDSASNIDLGRKYRTDLGQWPNLRGVGEVEPESAAVTDPNFARPGFKVERDFFGDLFGGDGWGKDFDTDFGRLEEADHRTANGER